MVSDIDFIRLITNAGLSISFNATDKASVRPCENIVEVIITDRQGNRITRWSGVSSDLDHVISNIIEWVFRKLSGKVHSTLAVGLGTYVNEERALAQLLNAGICFISDTDYLSPWPRLHGRSTCAVIVNCNDLFYWGTADDEDLPRKEILNLHRMWKANERFGTDKWCCLHRGLRPQITIVRKMKEEGFWDDDLEALPSPEPS